MKRFVFLVLTTSLVFTYCSGSKDNKTLREKKSRKATGDILVGAVASWESEKDEYSWQGLKLAVDEINSRNGIKGRKIRVIKEDDQGSLDKGLSIAEQFCNNTDILAVLGHSYSYITIPSSILYEYNGMVLIAPTSDSPSLSDTKGFRYIYQPVPDTDAYASRLIGFLEKNNINNILIFSKDDSFGNRFGTYFEKMASSKGLNIVARIPFSDAASDIFFRSKLIACYYYYDFDALLVAGEGTNAIPLLKYMSLYQLDFQLLGTEQFDIKELLSAAKEKKRKIIFPTAFDTSGENAVIERFISDFKKTYGVIPRSRAARWYNAMKFLAHAMEKSESLTPLNIINSISTIKKWNGVLGDTEFAGDNSLKVIQSNIVINEIKEDGTIQRIDSQSSSSPDVNPITDTE